MHVTLLFLHGILANAFDDLSVEKVCVKDGSYCFPKVVWIFWDKDITEDIEEMISITTSTLQQNFRVVFLTNTNLSDFLDLNSFPIYFLKIEEAMSKSDYIRTCLVTKYGGFWIDASTIVNNVAYLENMVSKAVKYRLEMVNFGHTNFFGCPENSTLMKIYKERYDVVLNDEDPVRLSYELCTEMCEKTGRRENCENFLFHFAYILHETVYKNPDLGKRIRVFKHPIAPKGFLRKYGSFREFLRCTSYGKTAPIVKIYHMDRNGTKFNITGVPGEGCEKYDSRMNRSLILFLALLLIGFCLVLFFSYSNSRKSKRKK